MNKFKLRLFGDSFKYARKRKVATKNIIVATCAILGSTIIAVLIGAMFGYNPFETISTLFSAGFDVEPTKIAYTLSVFALSAFAFSFCFKAGIFNIGISGQMYGAGVAVLAVATAIGDKMPNGLGQIVALIIAMAVGASIALLTGALERYFKVDPVVSAIIINWIVLLIGFFIIGSYYSNKPDNFSQMTASIIIDSHFCLNTEGFPGWAVSLIIVAIVAVIMLVLTKYTVFGHKINSTGLSLEGSRYAGYNVAAIKLSTFAISGAISGILAVVLYTANVPSIPATILNVTVPVEGFNGIAVGLIAGNNPIGIIAVSAIIGLFQTSASYLPMEATFSSVIIGLLMLGAALSVVFVNYKPYQKYLTKKYGMEAGKAYADFENKTDSLISKYKSIYSVYKKDLKNNTHEGKFNSVDEIYKAYINDLTNVKLTYKKESIIEWMTLRLSPEKYVKAAEEKIINDFDTNLTRYNSKQRAKIERNKELIAKNNPNKKTDAFLNEWLEKDNYERTNKISTAILQNTGWKNVEIAKAKKKLLRPFKVETKNINLNASSIKNFMADDARLNNINVKAINMIEKKMSDELNKKELLTLLANYNNEVYKNGGIL